MTFDLEAALDRLDASVEQRAREALAARREREALRRVKTPLHRARLSAAQQAVEAQRATSPIARSRQARGWAQIDLAAAAGLGIATIGRAERGRRLTWDTRRKIAAALGTRPANLGMNPHPTPDVA